MTISNQYETYLKHVWDNGTAKGDRTGTGTRSVFGYQMRFNLQHGFPLPTSKKVHVRMVVHELIWFLAGSTNIKYLQDNNVHIWDDWANPDGSLGPVYGHQWRSWPGRVKDDYAGMKPPGAKVICSQQGHGERIEYYQESIDQITNAINLLKTNPDSRRIIVTAWNPAEIEQMKLPPCHAFFQFYTEVMTLEERQRYCEDVIGIIVKTPNPTHEAFDQMSVPQRKLSCQLYQRSADSFLGVPFNIASYALLTEMFAQQCNMVAHEFIWTGGDCHIYDNHKDQVALQLSQPIHPYPKLKLNKAASIFDYKFADVVIEDYVHGPNIPAPIAV